MPHKRTNHQSCPETEDGGVPPATPSLSPPVTTGGLLAMGLERTRIGYQVQTDLQ